MVKNIVVIRAGALGDIILTLPALQALRLHYPDAVFRVVGYPALWEVAGSLIDEVISIDAAMFAGLFTGSPPAQLCNWLNGTDLVVAWTARDPRPALEACGVPHTGHASPYPPPGIHASVWLIDSIREQLDCLSDPVSTVGPVLPCRAALACTTEPSGITHPIDTSATSEGASHTGEVSHRCRLSLTTEEMERGREMLAAMGLQHPIAIHPGAGARWKRWPGGRFAGLMQELIRRGHQVVLIEGPADDEAVAEVQQQIAAEIPVLRQQPLRLLAASLAQCTLFAGNDSGVTHLAAAVGTPTLALFGPTDPLSWTPLENHPETIRVLRHCTCRTAYRGQVRVCDDPDCMQSIEIAEVLQAAQDLLANVQNPVENRRYSVDNFVDPPSTTGADTYHHHFNTPSSSQGPRV